MYYSSKIINKQAHTGDRYRSTRGSTIAIFQKWRFENDKTSSSLLRQPNQQREKAGNSTIEFEKRSKQDKIIARSTVPATKPKQQIIIGK